MQNKVILKSVVFAVIILFVGSGVIPVLSEDIKKEIDIMKIAADTERDKMEDPYQDGWPQTILGDPYMWGGIISPVVDDLDNDGAKEIILTQQTDPVSLYVFNHDGSLKFPVVQIPGYISPRSFTSVADIDYDGYKEIIVDVQSQIAIYNYEGTQQDLWNLAYRASDAGIYRAPVIADLNNDNALEVIYGGWDIDGSRLIVLDDQGVMMPGFPILLENIQMSEVNMPAVGNFDEDADLEIVVISHENNQPIKLSNIRAFNYDGSLLWSQQIDVIVSQSPSAGDVNNDGYDEVVFTSTKGIHILDRFGNYLVDNALGVDNTSSNVALADLDGDEYLEVIFGYQTSYSAMKDSGEVLWSYDTGYVAHYPPIVEDITGDGIPDVIVTSDYEIFGWDAQGDSLSNFPKAVEVNAYGACSVADIDNDQDIELIASSDWKWILYHGKDYNEGHIYIWDLSGTFNSSAMEWPMFHHDQSHTGRYEKDNADFADAGGPYQGFVGKEITFDASGSGNYNQDSSAGFLMYRWDWTNDGTWDTNWLNHEVAFHTYSEIFSGQVKLEVKNNEGYSDTDLSDVQITLGAIQWLNEITEKGDKYQIHGRE